jgi:tripartite-type tricarboxylate transporter receptor subunit TctC
MAVFATCVLAQGYPAKPVRYIVPMSAGSGADTIGRIVVSGLGPALGQQVIVDNRTGAAGNIGAELVAKAPPDGYTVSQGIIQKLAKILAPLEGSVQ